MLKKVLFKLAWVFLGVFLTILIFYVFGISQDKPHIGSYITNEENLQKISQELCKMSVPFSISIMLSEKYRKEYEKIILPYGVSPEKSNWVCKTDLKSREKK